MAVIVMGHVRHIDAGMSLGRNGADFIMQNGGVLPPSLLQENRVPRFYKEAIAKCGAPSQSQLPNTALVYNLMVTSCLPRAILGNIWSLVNRTMPGQLTRQEFFSCLALIALIQKGQPLSALSTMSALPIPHLQACAPFAHHLPGVDIFQQQGRFCQTVQKPESSGVAVNLQTTGTASSAISLLADIDFSKSVTNSTDFIQPKAISITQISASQSYPSVSTIGISHLDDTAVGTQFPVAVASNQSFDVTANLNNQILSKDINQSKSNVASSILQNPVLPDEIPNVLPDTSKSNSQTLVTIPCSDSNSTAVGADKTARILEPVRSPKSEAAECRSNDSGSLSSKINSLIDPDIYATMKLITGDSKDDEEEHLCVWRRCIEEAYTLLSNADSLLLCSTKTHVAEIVRTERGARYLNALYEIHEITMRIRKGKADKLIRQKELLDKIDQIWARLECFIEENIDSEDTDRFAETVNKAIPSLCGICLTRVRLSSMLEFTGIVYHKQCANLWINRVDSFLPKLKKY